MAFGARHLLRRATDEAASFVRLRLALASVSGLPLQTMRVSFGGKDLSGILVREKEKENYFRVFFKVFFLGSRFSQFSKDNL